MQYLRNTTKMPLPLRADGTNIVKWWVDVSYAVHPDMRSQTGGTMSLVKGAIISTSSKPKMTTKSSTETELIATDNLMSHILWKIISWIGKDTMPKAKFSIKTIRVHYWFEKNGKKSRSKRTKHIDIRYYFITERVKADELNIEYCPTGDMVVDYFTKPLQGKKFYQFRKEITNLKY